MIKIIDERISRALKGIRLGFRGVINLVKAAGSVQLVQIDALAGEQIQDAEYFQHYGFTSNPLPGSMAIVLPIGGRTAHGIVIATEHGTYRLKNLQSGEVALYSDEGDSIILKRGKLIEANTDTLVVKATTKVRFETPQVESTGEIIDLVGGTGRTMSGMRQIFNDHTQIDSNGDSVNPPGVKM